MSKSEPRAPSAGAPSAAEQLHRAAGGLWACSLFPSALNQKKRQIQPQNAPALSPKCTSSGFFSSLWIWVAQPCLDDGVVSEGFGICPFPQGKCPHPRHPPLRHSHSREPWTPFRSSMPCPPSPVPAARPSQGHTGNTPTARASFTDFI